MDAYHYHITLLTLEIIQKKFPKPVDFNAKGKKFNIIIIFLLLRSTDYGHPMKA